MRRCAIVNRDGAAAIQAGRRSERGAGGEISSQRLRDPARLEGGATSDDSADQPEARSGEAVRLCRDERAAAGTSVRESQTRLQGGVGRGKIRRSAVAGAV